MTELADRIAAILAIDPAAPAVEFERRWTSWGEIAAARAAVDAELERAGLGADSRVGLMMRNHAAMVPAIHAAIGTRCLVTLNPMLNADKLAADVAATGVAAVIGVARDLDGETVAAALGAAGCLVIEMTGEPTDPVRVRQQRSLIRQPPSPLW